MADPKRVNVENLTNYGEGPRSFFAADGQAQLLRPGESYSGDILEAEHRALSPDLRAATDGEASGTDAGGAAIERPSLDGMTRDGLIAQARLEGFTTIADQPGLDAEDIREAIEVARSTQAAEADAEAAQLAKDNTRAELVELAASEGVAIESDDNKADIAAKIIQARNTGE